ncbi:hypothetical protein [Paractinoplanes durhamensis]|uniref:Uncharacterized protein n=1 Tax=Paractinoplanes durhamensis TaxID=113563 RepID=A0ABQ3YR31_9ACTN|nr:hypothetical protein [Actinoplanes durhamensis]GIE00045.1 hypothetical protein Adu01nite_13950 [Actinoplanes durhamensis]
MADWFTQAEVGGGVTRIAEPHVNELLSANFWWLRGTDRDIKFLTGLDVSVVHPGHGPSFDRTRLHQLAKDYLRSKAHRL